MSKVNWNVLVRSKNNAREALKVLGANINPEFPECFMGSDLSFIEKQDYITAVPVEIAMTVEDRNTLRSREPGVRYVITGVKAEDVANLVTNFGYVAFDPIVVDKLSKEKEESYFEINGKRVSEEEFENVVKNAIQRAFEKVFF